MSQDMLSQAEVPRKGRNWHKKLGTSPRERDVAQVFSAPSLFCLVLFGHVFHKMEAAVVDRGRRMDITGSQVASQICNNKVCSFGLRSALCYMEGRTERERERKSFLIKGT